MIIKLKRGIRLIKIFVFLSIGCCFLYKFQEISLPKYYYDSIDPPAIKDFYHEPENSIDILAFGSSHMLYGFYPMELYKNFGLKAYNLGSSVQPIEASYYLLKESLKSQSPQLVLLDVSSLFYIDTPDESFWRAILDNMPLSREKLEFTFTYIEHDNDFRFADIIFPFIKFHERWNGLTIADFLNLQENYSYNKGGIVRSESQSSNISEIRMNEIAEKLLNTTQREIREYQNSIYSHYSIEASPYNMVPLEKNILWLTKIKKLCQENDVSLLLTKIPTVYNPTQYPSAWTKYRSEMIRQICMQHDIEFFDPLYDSPINIDWSTDSIDGGCHLNIFGAQKVTNCVGQYLACTYNIKSSSVDSWKTDLEIYQKVAKAASLEVESDITEYLDILKHNSSDLIIYISTSGIDSNEPSHIYLTSFQNLGLQFNLSDISNNAYIAVIDKGVVIYEGLSDFSVQNRGITSEIHQEYLLESNSVYSNPSSSIYIGGSNFSMNQPGINIVVCDSISGYVIDSVCLSMDGDHKLYRDKWKFGYDFLRNYEMYLLNNIL